MTVGVVAPIRGIGPLRYLSAVLRFAVLGADPTDPEDVPVWALCVPFRLWDAPMRFTGATFRAQYTRGAGLRGALLRVMPLRALYLMFLVGWPAVALPRALVRGAEAVRWYRGALFRPELALAHPEGRDTDAEIAWGRPDYALAMFHAWTWARAQPEWMRLDDKRTFLRACQEAGYPTPTTWTAAEAIARGGEFIVKDPERDLGYGVECLDAAEIAELDERDELIVQDRLRNHPKLRDLFGEDAPLSTLRVLTLLDAETGQLVILRTAIRIGRAGAVVDNTQQGGIWSSVDKRTGEILPGVTRSTYGRERDGAFVRFAVHPDSGVRFAGARVPWFDEGRAMALDAHRRLAPQAAALGWDIGLAESGPVLLEVNVWATCYDYDPPDDAFTPCAREIVARIAKARATSSANVQSG